MRVTRSKIWYKFLVQKRNLCKKACHVLKKRAQVSGTCFWYQILEYHPFTAMNVLNYGPFDCLRPTTTHRQPARGGICSSWNLCRCRPSPPAGTWRGLETPAWVTVSDRRSGTTPGRGDVVVPIGQCGLTSSRLRSSPIRWELEASRLYPFNCRVLSK